MECTERSKVTKDEFKKEILIEKKTKKNKQTHFGIVFLSLNILHHIPSSGYWYCYCEEEKNGEKVKKC